MRVIITHPVRRDPAVSEACRAHAERLRRTHVDGTANVLPGATVADLIVTLQRAAEACQ